jgi:Domain of unknown function (DUF4419)
MRTFAVSDVPPAVDPLPTVEPRAVFEVLAGGPLEAIWRPSSPLARAWTSHALASRGDTGPRKEAPFHGFVTAVHAAFNDHRPLVLTPDAVWLAIAQGFAAHVAAHAETLRSRVVSHAMREVVKVRRDDFVKGSPENPWPEMFAAFASEVAARTGELHGLVVADFSTTDATARAASEITLLSAAQPYFAYEFHSLCGIPEITLEGTAQDWLAIVHRAEGLMRYDATAWISSLLPVLHQFVEAHEGRVDVEFWRSFYKVDSGSGGPYITGWINVLLPYVFKHERAMAANPAAKSWREGLRRASGGGPTTENLPSGLSRVPFLWKFLQHEFQMELLGGFAGVSQDPHTLALRPEIGWAVREKVS